MPDKAKVEKMRLIENSCESSGVICPRLKWREFIVLRIFT